MQQQQQPAALQPPLHQQPPALQHAQVSPPAASVHDSAATVQSVDFSKALQHAQAQAQVQGIGSQVVPVRSQTQALHCSDTRQDARHLERCREAGSA